MTLVWLTPVLEDSKRLVNLDRLLWTEAVNGGTTLHFGEYVCLTVRETQEEIASFTPLYGLNPPPKVRPT